MKIDTQLKTLIGIYCLQNTLTGKRYIGSSTNIYQRGLKHRAQLRGNSHPNKKLQNSYNKHNEKDFIFYVVELCNKEILIQKEQYYIDTFNPEYNLILQVEKHELTAESKLKISATLKEKYKQGYKNKSEIAIDVYTRKGEYVSSYLSMTSCAKELNVSLSSVKRIIKGVTRYCGNYVFYKKGDTKIKTHIFKKELPKEIKTGKTVKIPLQISFEGQELSFKSVSDASKYFQIPNRTFTRWVKEKTLIQKLNKLNN
jgi:hypothetical protein